MTDSTSLPQIKFPERYRVNSEIGRGGVSVVYLGEDLESGRSVAIKVLKDDIASGVAVGRFLREIAVHSRLQHDHIVPVLDAGEIDGVPFLVLPHIAKGSLRQRLQREAHLSWHEALGIARDVGQALDAAHAAGVVHRDVKPENILLGSEHALLADFGIARAFSEAATERLTESGIVIGTAGYMSPEQCEGVRELDARSDVYSLACVTYEMLAGEPPYTGPSRIAIAAKQMTLPIPSVRLLRSGLTEAVDDVFKKALAKVPADRYQRAGDFVEALTKAGRSNRRRWSKRARIGAAAAGAVGFLAMTLSTRDELVLPGAAVSDTTSYLVYPFANDSSGDLTRRVRNAFLGWDGIQIADMGRVGDALRGRSPASMTSSALSRVARRLSVSRYVRGQVLARPDGSVLQMGLYDSDGGSPLAEASGAIETKGGSVDSGAIQLLVDSLLLRGAADSEQLRPGVRRSLAARQYFLRGERALAEWNLSQAELAFDSAASLDTGYVRPRLLLALVRAWTRADPARWRIAAEQAGSGSARLSPRERGMADAILAQARGDLGVACPAWERAVALDTLYSLSWYGSAHCKSTDTLVLADGSSPSGFRFRSSYHQALIEYQRSFQLQPAILTSFRDRSFESLRRLFRTSATQLRSGFGVNRADRYAANQWWQGDSLAFVPYPMGRGIPADYMPNRVAMNEALRRQRGLMRSVASTWVAAFPSSTDARLALGVALALLGDRSSLDTVVRARHLARNTSDQSRALAVDVSLQLAFAVAERDTAGVRRVRLMADSIIADSANPDADRVLLASLAALTGRASLAASISSSSVVASSLSVPTPLHHGAASLLVYAALGGPRDSLALLEQRVADVIDRALPPDERARRRLEFLGRALGLAYPMYQSGQIPLLATEGDPLCALEAAFMSGDSSRVRRGLQELRSSRRNILPESLTLDALVPEAELFIQLDDQRGAWLWISPTLASLPMEAQRLLASPVRAASLVRAMMIGARSATAAGDDEASRRMAHSVAILWSDADQFLLPLVSEARRLSSR